MSQSKETKETVSTTDEQEVKTYISNIPYTRKDGSIGYSTCKKVYKPTGNPPGRKRTPQSIAIAEIRKLSDKNAEKVNKYIKKLTN